MRIVPRETSSSPGPSRWRIVPPGSCSTMAGSSQVEMPGPVATSAQTSSAVPSTAVAAAGTRALDWVMGTPSRVR
jgi:hypothetical protein